MDVNSLFGGQFGGQVALFGGQFGGPVALFRSQFGGSVGATEDRTVKGGHLEVGISSMAAERRGNDRYDGGLWRSN